MIIPKKENNFDNENEILSGYRMTTTSATQVEKDFGKNNERMIYKCNQCDEEFDNKNGFQIHHSGVHEGKKICLKKIWLDHSKTSIVSDRILPWLITFVP